MRRAGWLICFGSAVWVIAFSVLVIGSMLGARRREPPVGLPSVLYILTPETVPARSVQLQQRRSALMGLVDRWVPVGVVTEGECVLGSLDDLDDIRACLLDAPDGKGCGNVSTVCRCDHTDKGFSCEEGSPKACSEGTRVCKGPPWWLMWVDGSPRFERVPVNR